MSVWSEIYGVAGLPITHSFSPAMFNAAFKRYKYKQAVYLKFLYDDPQKLIETFKELEIRALNLTSPLKIKTLDYADEISEEAKAIGAINLLIDKNGKIRGENVDWLGVRNIFLYNGLSLKDKKVLIVGAGGAARAAAYAAFKGGAKIFAANRTAKKAEEMAAAFGGKVVPFEKINENITYYDAVIYAAPIKDFKFPEFDEKQIVLIADYSTPLKIKTKARVFDGTEWLIKQAAATWNKLGYGESVEEIFREALLEDKKKKISFSKISIVGFSGAGKTTIGKILAKKLGKEFYDLDEVIEKTAGKTINEIFREKGEPYFRELERSALKEIAKKKSYVVSCGGGAPLDKRNRETLKRQTFSIWFFSDLKKSFERVAAAGRKRHPYYKVATTEKLARKLFEFRVPFYCEVSDLAINSDGNPREIAEVLYEEIRGAIERRRGN